MCGRHLLQACTAPPAGVHNPSCRRAQPAPLSATGLAAATHLLHLARHARHNVHHVIQSNALLPHDASACTHDRALCPAGIHLKWRRTAVVGGAVQAVRAVQAVQAVQVHKVQLCGHT
jgi:hypothetical protein